MGHMCDIQSRKCANADGTGIVVQIPVGCCQQLCRTYVGAGCMVESEARIYNGRAG